MQDGAQFEGLQDEEEGKQNSQQQAAQAEEKPDQDKNREDNEEEDDAMDAQDEEEKAAESNDCKGIEKKTVVKVTADSKTKLFYHLIVTNIFNPFSFAGDR